MNTKNLIQKAVKAAQSSKRNWQVGDTVAHPDQPITLEIQAIHGDTATIGYGAIQEVRPLNELFDPNQARDLAVLASLKGGAK